MNLVAGHTDDVSLDPKEARKIRNKIDWIILPLIFSIYTRMCRAMLKRILANSDIYKFNSSTSKSLFYRIAFLWINIFSRGSLGAAAVLGIIEDNHLTVDQFNTLGSAFYIGERLNR